jgi:polyhydroxyalkanoate synthesis regulator phasin
VLAKLRSIQAHIAGNRITAARNQIAALITQLEDMVADGSLTAEQGAHLIELAQALLASL